MKLEIKHLVPYLPYGLKVSSLHTLKVETGIGSINHIVKAVNEGKKQYRPRLRPLSDLTEDDFKEELYHYYQTLGIDVKLVNYDSGNDNPFDMTLTVTYKMMGEVYTECLINRGSTSETPYHIIVWLCENHFDIFGLISEGLAIDINDVSLADA